MGLKIEYNKSADASLDIYLNEILMDSEIAEKEALKTAGNELKDKVEKNLLRHKRQIQTRYNGRPAFADDVKLSIKKGKNGNNAAIVQGGKSTGTLWHIVNDGTLHANGIHFMDKAIAEIDQKIDGIMDKVMK